MRCHAIVMIAAIIIMAAVAGTKELYRWIKNRRYSRRVRIVEVRIW